MIFFTIFFPIQKNRLFSLFLLFNFFNFSFISSLSSNNNNEVIFYQNLTVNFQFNVKKQEEHSLFHSIQLTNQSKGWNNVLIFTREEDISHSFGNYLSDYLETRICANISNLHFYNPLPPSNPTNPSTTTTTITTSTTSITTSHPSKSTIIRHNFPLSRFIFHPHSISIHNKTIEEMKKLCPCDRNCHGEINSLIFSHPFHVKEILLPLFQLLETNFPKFISLSSSNIWKITLRSLSLQQGGEQNQRKQPNLSKKSITSSTISTPDSIHSIPSVPDVIIHYRCSDNVRHKRMGLLTFQQFNHTLIPPNTTQSIYIITEPLSRTSTGWHFPPGSCDSILTSLHEYLSNQFPKTTIVTLRGEPLLHDLYRIYSTKIIFCSASTFCYYPALLSPYSNYKYPLSSISPLQSNPPVVYTPFSGLISGLYSLLPSNHETTLPITRQFHSHFHDLGKKAYCNKFVLLGRFSNQTNVINCLMNSCIC